MFRCRTLWRLLLSLATLSGVGCQTTPSELPQDVFRTGNLWLNEAGDAERQSRQRMLEANQLRKTIGKLHGMKRKNPEQKSEFETQIRDLGQEMVRLRKEGATLRDAGTKMKANALGVFERALTKRWQGWVTNTEPMILTSDFKESRAHNPRILSADPKILNRQSLLLAAADLGSGENQLAIRAEALKEQNAPTTLNVSPYQISHLRKLVAHVQVRSEDQDAVGVPLNQIHSWQLILSDVDGNPVDHEIEVTGHMPGHVHGLPTQPRVTKKLGPGVYLVEGMKFQMRGWWVMEFLVGNDRVKFNLVL